MKIRLYQIISFLAIILILAGLVFALPVNKGIDRAKASGLKNTIALPTDAIEVSSGVFYLGKAFDRGRIVEGYAFVRYKEGHGKPTGCNNDGACQGWEDSSCADCSGGGGGEPTTDTSSCYGFLAKGAKWKTVEDYIVNTANTKGLTDDFVVNNLDSDITKWETAANLGILGGGSSTTETLVADTLSPDNQNEVYFADIEEDGAIAITIVWGYFGGPPQWRELVEWDMIFDDEDFDWGMGEADKMDFENIATHELGHSVGLDDLYDGKCSEMTMYGYASDGEIKKRDLEDGDIVGIKELYG